MKKLLTAIAIICWLNIQAQTYYVAAAGNDGNTGLSPAAAWKTLTKVNSFTFASGAQMVQIQELFNIL